MSCHSVRHSISRVTVAQQCVSESDTVQAPSAAKARGLDEELAQAANTPLPEDEDAGNAAADQQTDSAGGVAAGQVRTPPQPLFMLWRKVRAPVY